MMRLYNLAGHGQPDPCAAYADGLAGGAAHEFLENLFLLGGGNADTPVANPDANGMVCRLCDLHPHRGTLRRVLDGIIEEVGYSTAERGPVGGNGRAGAVVGQFDPVSVGLRIASELRH